MDDPGGGTHIFFCTGTCRWTGYHFQDSDSGTGYHFCKNRLHDRVHLSFLTPKGRFRPFALCECDSNRLDSNISTFFDRFRTNFLARAQFCLKKLKDRVLFK